MEIVLKLVAVFLCFSVAYGRVARETSDRSLRCAPVTCSKDCIVDVDSDGCEKCVCLEPLKLCGSDGFGFCPKDYRCEKFNNSSDSLYECLPIKVLDIPGCHSILCAKKCDYGYKRDSNGCPLCQCLPSPCIYVDCLHPKMCTTVPNEINTYPPFKARCECPKLKCQPCKHQFVFENGCQTCECRDMCSELSTAKPLFGAKPCALSCDALKCSANKICCKDFKGCYGCRNEEECSL